MLKRREIKDKGKKLFYKIFLLLFLSSLIIYSQFFILIVKEIKIIPEKLQCPDETSVRQVVSNNIGKNIFFISDQKISGDILKKFYCVKSVGVRKSFNLVEINLSQRYPKAIIIQATKKLPDLKYLDATSSSEAANLSRELFIEASNSAGFLVDETGLIFTQNSKEDNLPVFYVVDENLKLGKSLGGEIIQKTLLATNKLAMFSVPLQKVIIDDGEILIIGEVEVFFSGTGDFDRQLASLQLILQKAKIESKVIKSIDLRFKKPVVVYSKK